MIGVFDSGLGGLTILKALLEKIPEYNYIYLGDSARTPYGGKSKEVIFSYTKEALDFLFQQGCELVIIACNTVSAKTLRQIQQEYLPKKHPDKKVLGVLIPAAEAVDEFYKKQKNKKQKIAGVIATRATIDSKTYETEINKLDQDIRVITKATPLLVPLVEEGWANKPETKTILKKYLRPLKDRKIQTLILGCTHYPFLEKQIKQILGKNIKIINTPEAVAKRLVVYLEKHPEIEKKLKKEKLISFYTTDSKNKFKILGEKFLGQEIVDLKQIEL